MCAEADPAAFSRYRRRRAASPVSAARWRDAGKTNFTRVPLPGRLAIPHRQPLQPKATSSLAQELEIYLQFDRVRCIWGSDDLAAIPEEQIDDVKIDAKQSYGHHLTLLGGIDVDFLCRSTEEEIRARVPRMLGAYLAIMVEGRRYSAWAAFTLRQRQRQSARSFGRGRAGKDAISRSGWTLRDEIATLSYPLSRARTLESCRRVGTVSRTLRLGDYNERRGRQGTHQSSHETHPLGLRY